MKIFVCYSLFLCLGISNTFSQIHWDSLEQATLANINYNEGPRVMYADSSYLYMGGAFTEIDGKHMQGISRWNGVKWDSMGKGIDGLAGYDIGSEYPNNTLAITTYHNILYVGGVFMSLGEAKAPCIGTWNGSTWDSIPIQPFTNNNNDAVQALDVINNKLYVGGEFDTVAGQSGIIGIACWNDTNWSSLNFPNLANFENIGAICEYNGSIYAAGIFYGNTLNDTNSNILRWNGTNWRSVGGGIKGGFDWPMCMAVYNGELYVAGYFFQSDGNIGDNIQRWDGTNWHGVGGGINWEVFNLIVYNGKLYAMGSFTEVGGIPASKIAEWDGTKWCSLGSTFDNTIETTCVYKDSLYIGGGFTKIDADSIVYIAEWTGGNYTDGCGNDVSRVTETKIQNPAISVYPNPSNGTFILSLSNINAACNVEIYNVLGEKIYTETLLQNQNTINLTGQPRGVYFFRVIQQDGGLVGEGKVEIQK